MEKRDKNFDYTFFDAMSVTYKWHQPWQVSLWLPDTLGKFVWYPEKGTLMHEKGNFNTKKIGEYLDSEDVYNKMITASRDRPS